MYEAEVRITPRKGILDPEGETISRALGELGYAGVEEVRAGRLVTIRMQGSGSEAVEEEVERMCEELIANPVIEDYEIRVREAPTGSSGPGNAADAESPREGGDR